MINVNLLGEVYIDDNKTFTVVDTNMNNLVYIEISNSRKVIAYPVFVGDKPQMLYETLDKNKYKRIIDRKTSLDKYNVKEEIPKETHKMLLHKRVNNFKNLSHNTNLFEDFAKGSVLNWYDNFPTLLNQDIDIRSRDKFNRIFASRVLDKDLFVGEDFVKVTVTKPYKSTSPRVLIKRKPEDCIMSVSEDNTRITSIKFKTKAIEEIFELVQDIELIHDYNASTEYEEDLLCKVSFAKKLIDTKSYVSVAMEHKILKVLALAMYRCDLSYQHKLTKDVVVNILTGNHKYFGDYITDVNKSLNGDALAYLKSIYIRSEYRDSVLGHNI